jgi:hypothetical protein
VILSVNDKRAEKTGRHRAVEPEFELKLEDTIVHAKPGLRPRRKSPGSGYNPYDTVPVDRPREPKKTPKDLRKLSEWIRLQRQVSALKKTEPEENEK